MSCSKLAACCRYESSLSGSRPARREGLRSSCSRLKYQRRPGPAPPPPAEASMAALRPRGGRGVRTQRGGALTSNVGWAGTGGAVGGASVPKQGGTVEWVGTEGGHAPSRTGPAPLGEVLPSPPPPHTPHVVRGSDFSGSRDTPAPRGCPCGPTTGFSAPPYRHFYSLTRGDPQDTGVSLHSETLSSPEPQCFSLPGIPVCFLPTPVHRASEIPAPVQDPVLPGSRKPAHLKTLPVSPNRLLTPLPLPGPSSPGPPRTGTPLCPPPVSLLTGIPVFLPLWDPGPSPNRDSRVPLGPPSAPQARPQLVSKLFYI